VEFAYLLRRSLFQDLAGFVQDPDPHQPCAALDRMDDRRVEQVRDRQVEGVHPGPARQLFVDRPGFPGRLCIVHRLPDPLVVLLLFLAGFTLAGDRLGARQ
jgi:hypothetical protein